MGYIVSQHNSTPPTVFQLGIFYFADCKHMYHKCVFSLGFDFHDFFRKIQNVEASNFLAIIYMWGT